jgi:L-aminopeptidase/D-esterase-like protein
MVCHAYKGGTGTASRLATVGEQTYRVGVLVQANHGRREDLTVAGLPVGRLIQGFDPEPPGTAPVDGSILVIIATDAPLDSAQLERLARRATIGLARTGGYGGALSGDIFLAFSTAEEVMLNGALPLICTRLPGESLDPLFLATAWATEEAIVNALVGARTMVSAAGLKIHALPHEPLAAWMRKRQEMLS